MPAVAAHYYFGQMVLKNLPISIKKNIALCKHMFDLGLQGPDIWFYHNGLTASYAKSYGINLHAKHAHFFLEHACAQIEKSSSPKARAYLYGFVCHFMLDSTCHPAVNICTKTSKQHIALETELERIVLLNQGEKYPHRVHRVAFVPKVSEIDFENLHLVYSELSSWCEKNRKKTNTFKKTIEDYHFYSVFLHSPTGFMKRFVSLAEKLLNSDLGVCALPLSKKMDEEWQEPAEKVFSLFNKAKMDGIEGIIDVERRLSEKTPLSERFNRTF